MLTEEECVLIADIGIYGCWILKHAPTIGPEHPQAQAMWRAYEMYAARSEPDACMVLLEKIDEFIAATDWEPTIPYYPAALANLHLHRGEK